MDKNDEDNELALVNEFANRLSLNRAKTEGAFFDSDYRRNEDTNLFELVSRKAVVRSFGKTTKILIGQNEECRTYQEAEVKARAYWSEYFKNRRQMAKSENFRVGERRRQKTHYDLTKLKNREIDERQ